MIKVMQVLSDTNIGGAGKWILNLLEYINKKEFDISVAIPRGSLLKKELEKQGALIIEIPGKGDSTFEASAVRYLYKYFKENKIDIVHSHASMSARIAGKLAGVKSIVYTRHCMESKTEGRIGKLANKTINMHLSNKVVAVSKSVKENLILSGVPEHRIELIYNGVKPLNLNSEEKNQLVKANMGIEENEVVVGIVARLEEIKGHKYFIKAAHKVLKENPSVKFIIVGSGSLEDDLKKLTSELGINNKVIFTGHLEDTTDIVNIMDINVLSSLSEALSLSLIEAMSLGKPCITTKTGGNPEVITGGLSGMLVSVKDEEALANSMLNLINNKDLREVMGKKGKEVMLDKFTVKGMTKKIENLYRNLIINNNQ
jgi:glycosyltransferase involved in cell wall biosynthesis